MQNLAIFWAEAHLDPWHTWIPGTLRSLDLLAHLDPCSLGSLDLLVHLDPYTLGSLDPLAHLDPCTVRSLHTQIPTNLEPWGL